MVDFVNLITLEKLLTFLVAIEYIHKTDWTMGGIYTHKRLTQSAKVTISGDP
jgi:hypothetical protein